MGVSSHGTGWCRGPIVLNGASRPGVGRGQSADAVAAADVLGGELELELPPDDEDDEADRESVL